MNGNDILKKIDQLKDRYIKVWEDVCNIESPTADKAGVDEVGRYFIRMAKERGWKVEVCPQEVSGDAICITLNPESDAAPVTLSGHIDTVHPKGLFGTPAVRKEGDRIMGPGVSDCKGGVVASFLAMDALDQCGFKGRPVQLIIQSDEETGSKGSQHQTIRFMQEKAKGSVAFLNTEYAVKDTAILICKGIMHYRITVTGKAVHASRSDTGASAIAEAAHQIIRLEQHKDPNGLICNCGLIEGGTVPNTVAAKCSFTVDFRFATHAQRAEAEALIRELTEHSFIEGCSAEAELFNSRPAMPLCEKNQGLLDRMNEIYEKYGLSCLRPRLFHAGTDAAYIAEIGVPCVDGMGVIGGDIHGITEWAEISSLGELAKRMALIARDL